MIIIRTRVPEEIVKQLSDYFYIDGCYAIVTTVEELDDISPMMVLTNNEEVIVTLESNYPCITINDIDSNLLIDNGFLPISDEVIIKYANETYEGITGKELVLKIFESLGYVRSKNKLYLPTIKLIETISDLQPNISNAYKIFLNNIDCYDLTGTNIQIVNDSVYESLKLIDVYIHECILHNFTLHC